MDLARFVKSLSPPAKTNAQSLNKPTVRLGQTKAKQRGIQMTKLRSTIMTLLATSATAFADDSGDTVHPVVLVHGLAGFDSALGYDYFYGVKAALQDVGTDDIYTPRVTAWETNTARGEELLAYVEDLVATTDATKVNLIGHSQGGPTARYVASVRPDLVASVTSVGSPHFGSETADLVDNAPDILVGPVADIVNAFGDMIAYVTGDPAQETNALGALEALNSTDAAVFNAAHPQGLRQGSCQETPVYNANTGWLGWLFPNWVYDYSVNDGDHEVNGVRYYSWSGTYNPVTNSNVLDIADGGLGLASLTHSEDNDGVVGRCKSHMGQVIRDDYVLNHMDEVNWTFGLRGLGTSDPLAIYTQHVQRLKNSGL